MFVPCNDNIQHHVWFDSIHLLVADPLGNIERANRRTNTHTKGAWTRSQNIYTITTFVAGLISTLYTHCHNYSAIWKLLFLAINTSLDIKCKSIRVYHYFTRHQHLQHHDDAWPTQQIKTLSTASSGFVPNIHQYTIHLTPTMQCLPPKCSEFNQKMKLLFVIPVLRTLTQ